MKGCKMDNTVCNICGNYMDVFDKQQEFSINKKIHYGSKYDGCTIGLNICSECMDRIIDECEVSPICEN